MNIRYIEDWAEIHKIRGWILIPAGFQIDLNHQFVLSTFQRRFFPPAIVSEIQHEVTNIIQLTGLIRYGIIDFPQFRLGLFQIAYDYNHEINMDLAQFSLSVLKEWLIFRNILEVGIIVPKDLLWLFSNLLDVLPESVTLIMLKSSKGDIESENTMSLKVDLPMRKSLFGQRSLLSYFSHWFFPV